MSGCPNGWLSSLSSLPSLAVRCLFRFSLGTVDSLSGSPDVGSENSSSHGITIFDQGNLRSESPGEVVDHIPDAVKETVPIVPLFTEALLPGNSNSQGYGTGALPFNISDKLGHQRNPAFVLTVPTAHNPANVYANRPGNISRPWLPRFPKLRRRLPLQPREPPPESNSQRPKTISFPNQRFLIDTTYPRLTVSDPKRVDIEETLRSVRHFQQQLGLQSSTDPSIVRPPSHYESLFVKINGNCTRKRRAEDPEVDLVASVQCPQNAALPVSLVITRSPFNPDCELEYQEKYQRHMFNLQPIYRRITGMMSSIFTTCADLGDRLRRYLYNQPYSISERLFYAANPKTNEVHISNKRRKVVSEECDFQWLDRDGLNLLVSRYDHLRDCFNRTCVLVRQCPSRAQVNNILAPLLPALADNDHDLEKLRAGEHKFDLCSLYLLLCQQMFTFLDAVYEIGHFIKAKDKHPRVPKAFEYPISTEARETVARIKNLTSARHLVPVLRNILDLGGHATKDYPLPIDIIGYVALDMTAVEHNIIIPSYIMPNYFHRKLVEELLPPGLKNESYEGVPGSYPEEVSPAPEQQKARVELQVKEDRSSSAIPSLAPRIAKADATKTAHLRANFLAAKISRLTPSEFRAKFHGHNTAYQSIKATSVTDFEPRQPPKEHEIRAVRSILKNRKAPKRLTMQRAPKSVRFTESTISPRPRTHLGLDVPTPTVFDSDEASTHIVTASQKDFSFQDDESLSRLANRRFESIFRGTRAARLSTNYKKRDPSAEIEKILSLPSIQSLAISDDTKAGIALKKERAAQKAAEEAKRLAEEQAQKERYERLARSGGLRIPDQPLVSPLSSDWLARAHATLRAGASTTLATTGEGVDLRRHDFARVIPPTEWLNDEIVNGSLNWLDKFVNMAAGIKDVKRSTRKCLAMSSFFFKRLQEQGVARTQRTLRRYGVEKTNFLNIDTILLPVCEHSHWTLIVVRPSKRTVAHLDSMSPRGSQQYTNLCLAWLKDVLEEQFVENEWKVVRHEAPRQTNGYDCGVHTITNGMCIALGLNPIDSYAVEDLPRQRLRIACMLLNGGFKGDFDLRLY